MYDEYWRNPARIGESSFENAEQLAKSILNVCGVGRYLDVGFGAGRLIAELTMYGIVVIGLDASKVAVERLNARMPDTGVNGTATCMPFKDSEFDVVVSTDCFEHLARDDVKKAFSELYRVTKKYAFLRIAVAEDRERKWHLTVEQEEWWENQAFAAGFRKHPGILSLIEYTNLEYKGYSTTLLLEKIPEEIFQKYPLSHLQKERDLHMDMLRESGRRSDAHLNRYKKASDLVRPGDVVVDAACGLGYGSHLIASTTEAGSVVGFDLSVSAMSMHLITSLLPTGVCCLEIPMSVI